MKDYAEEFYQSKQWKKTRAAYMASRYYVCERCGGVARIVHHINHLNKRNINNPSIALDWSNLEALCMDCHNKEHFVSEYTAGNGLMFDENGMVIQAKRVFLVTGCYGSGKTHYVKEHMNVGDLVVDMDLLFMALSFQGMHETPDALLPTVWDTRDYLYGLIRQRKGNWKNAWVVAALPDRQKRMDVCKELRAELIEIETDLDACIKNIHADESRTNKHAFIMQAQEYFSKLTPPVG